MNRRRKAFSLVELMTVAFILGVMVALLLPAIQRYRAYAQKKKAEQIIQAIRLAVGTYQKDFEKLPPSEPDMVDDYYYGRTIGGASLLNYLNGATGGGYAVGNRTYEPRVTNAQAGSAGGYTGFLDSWGSVIDYFVAYRDRPAWRGVDSSGNPAGPWPRPSAQCRGSAGETTADVFPRACNVGLSGSGDYLYTYTVGSSGQPSRIGGKAVHVAVARWLDGWPYYVCPTHSTQTTTTKGAACPTSGCGKPMNVLDSNWKYHATPVQVGGFILVSAGSDGMWGTADDVGDVAKWDE